MANKFTLFILVLFWGYQTSAQNLLTNGSFENGYGTCGIARPSTCTPPASCAFCAPGEAQLGWTWVSGNMDLYQSGVMNSDFKTGLPMENML